MPRECNAPTRLANSVWLFQFLFIVGFVICASSSAQEPLTTWKVLDGDSLILSDGQTIRLIGVDTPEYLDHARNRRNAKQLGISFLMYETYSEKARYFVMGLIGTHSIRLEFDPINASRDHKDRYDRTLAYVYIETEDGEIFLNQEIIKEGYGFALNFFPFKYQGRFNKVQAEAKAQSKGFWL